MYAREVNGKNLTFSVSGKLWADSLVMLDKETGSQWSHLLGEAMTGPLAGTVLDSFPSLMTNWKTWKAKHPETSVVLLERTATQFSRDFVSMGISGQLVVGLVLADESRSWSFGLLEDNAIINDSVADTNILVLFERESITPCIFKREIDGIELSFEDKDCQVVDTKTGSVWDRIDGRCTEGSFKGKQLKLLPAIVSFDRAWKSFHPSTTEWSP